MGFLNPLFLFAAAAVAVPLILHLFHRHELRRIAFPALRYLLRATRDHARTIRFRQLLLLVLRIATCLLLVAAGARLFWKGAGGTHRPTALAVILDNSMSSGRVQGERRFLDKMKGLALETVDEAGPEDRIWLIRAGEPWDVAVPGSRADARLRILEAQVSEGAGDLAVAIERAGALVAGAAMEESEIQLLSDLQASAFPGADALRVPAGTRILAYEAREAPADNRYLDEVLVGAGLTPMANERSEVAVSVGQAGNGTDTVAVRLVVGGRVVGASAVTTGAQALIPMGPFAGGIASGYVEMDPDALRADDRRYFSFMVRPPTNISLQGGGSFFFDQAVGVLTQAGRARVVGAGGEDVLITFSGEGLENRSVGSAAIVVPPLDGTLLPALNRRLAASGISWRYEGVDAIGEVGVGENRLPQSLEGVRVRRHYRLSPTAEGGDARVQVALDSGDPWIVTGSSVRGPFLLLASSVDTAATNLAVSASMLPLVEWMVARWPSRGGAVESLAVGDAILVPAGITTVVDPVGQSETVGSARSIARHSGIHQLLVGDSVVQEVAVNVPGVESRLARIDDSVLGERLGDYAMADSAAWRRSAFGSREGPELWRWLLLAALALLLTESWIAASGRRQERSRGVAPMDGAASGRSPSAAPAR